MSMNTRFLTVLKGCFIHGKHTTENYPTEFPQSPLFPNYFKDYLFFCKVGIMLIVQQMYADALKHLMLLVFST